MKNKSLIAFGVAATAISLLLLAGCGGNTGASSSNKASSSSAASATSTTSASNIPESISNATNTSVPNQPNG